MPSPSAFRKVLIIAVCVVAVLAIALGVGLGVGLHDEHKSSQNGSAVSSPSPTASGSGAASLSSSTKTKLQSSSVTSISSSAVIPATSTFTSALPTSSGNSANPVKVASKLFLGNVTSSNTPDIRDLGFMGNIGNDYIMSFGDTIPCKTYQRGCVGLEAPNSGGIITSSDTILQYTDINVNKNGHAEIFVPLIDGEPPSYGLGLSNVVETGPQSGIILYLRNNRTGPSQIEGAGVAFVDTSSGWPVVTRPNVGWWSPQEPFFGDHNAILSQTDGHIYAYGGFNGSYGNAIFLTRVPQSAAANFSAYEYWNGTAFTSQRLFNPPQSASVFSAGQGSITWSPYYNKYLYFKPGCPGGSCILVMAADEPWGPWSSSSVGVFGTGDSPDHFLMYAPVVLTKWSDPAGRYLIMMYTGRGQGFGNMLQAFNLTFA